MRVPRVLVTGVVVAAAATGLVVGPAAAEDNKVLVQDSSSDFDVRPSAIGFTGDSSGYFGRLRGRRGYLNWRLWDQSVAEGTAIEQPQPLAAILGKGRTFAIHTVSSSLGTTYYGFMFDRRGRSVRYVFYPSAGAYGCFKGVLAGGQLEGVFLSVGNGYSSRSTKPKRIWASGRSIKVQGFRGSFIRTNSPQPRVRRGMMKLKRYCVRYLP